MSTLEFTDAEWSSLAAEFCKGFTKDQADTCRTFCRLRNLIPGKHILFQLRKSKEWDEVVNAKVEVTKIVFITTIDAARLIALRSGEYIGQDPEVYIYLNDDGTDFIESKIPLPQLPIVKGQTAPPREPWAVRTTVHRKSFAHPISSVARFDAYAATYRTVNGSQLTEMWVRRPGEQLAKCCEMLSLRKAFPEELGSLYIAEEFKAESEDVRPPVGITPASVVPLPPTAPKVNQTPAVGKEEPRPNEAKVEYHVTSVPATLPEHSGSVLVVKEAAKEETPEPPKPVTPQPDTAAVEAAKAAVPSIQTAAEIEPPKKRSRKPKENPVNGQKTVDGGITDADIANAGEPAPEQVTEAEKAEGAAFVESLDPTPTKEEMTGFTARVRALTAAGAVSTDLKNYILDVGKKSDTKLLTVGNWKEALDKLEAIPKDQLKEVTKNAPLPAF